MTVYTLKYDTFSVQCHDTVFHFKTTESDFLRNDLLQRFRFHLIRSVPDHIDCGSSALQSTGASTFQENVSSSEISFTSSRSNVTLFGKNNF